MNTVNTYARRVKGVVTSMPEGRGVWERLPPKGKASTADAAVEYTRKGVHWRRRHDWFGDYETVHQWCRYEPCNSIPPFGASPARPFKGNNRNQQVTKEESLDVGVSGWQRKPVG